MTLSIGIVGLPNVGKSTLFNALTSGEALAANYPFATISPNTGVVVVPDPRVERVAELSNSATVVHATVTFVDIAGLVEGASRGEGLGNKFLGNIREVDAICHVVRAFASDNVVHIGDRADPRRDIETVETELALADLETIDRRLPRLEKEATVDRSLQGRAKALRAARDVVATGSMLGRGGESAVDLAGIPDLSLLTTKPTIYVFNMDDRGLADLDLRASLSDLVHPAPAIFIDAQLEAELAELSPEDRAEMLAEVGQDEPGLHTVIRTAYETLGLQSFLTTGEKESRAWTIRVGATAYDAAGVIHTDFQRGFIAAEVVDYDELLEHGSWQAAKTSGRVRTEGRQYVMQPGDVVQFRFNV